MIGVFAVFVVPRLGRHYVVKYRHLSLFAGNTVVNFGVPLAVKKLYSVFKKQIKVIFVLRYDEIVYAK